jgi:hypothetical protein
MAANPFAALSLIVAPAILTNASSMLVLSTSNRLARAVDRARQLSQQIEGAADKTDAVSARRLAELATTETRSLLLVRSMRSCYVALSGFASAALISLLGAVLVETGPAFLGQALELLAVFAGIIAVGALIVAAIGLFRDAQMAVSVLQDRAAHLREQLDRATSARQS